MANLKMCVLCGGVSVIIKLDLGFLLSVIYLRILLLLNEDLGFKGLSSSYSLVYRTLSWAKLLIVDYLFHFIPVPNFRFFFLPWAVILIHLICIFLLYVFLYSFVQFCLIFLYF